MAESVIDDLLNWFQAFVMALYSISIILFGISVLGYKYVEIISIYNSIANSYILYIVWLTYGSLMLSVLFLVLMGFSLGFNKFDYALSYFGIAIILASFFDLSYIMILYSISSELTTSQYILGASGVLKLIAGVLTIKLSRVLEEEPSFIPLVMILLTIPLISGIVIFFEPNYVAADIFEMIWDYTFNVVSYSASDLIYLPLGGYLAPLSISAVLIALFLAKRAGDFKASFGAKVSLTFGAFIGVFGISISLLGDILDEARNIIVYNIGIEQSVITHYFEALSLVIFLGLLLLTFFILSNYYVVVPMPKPTEERRVERHIEETVEEAAVTAKEKEEGEELIEGLEELEFEEFEDLGEL